MQALGADGEWAGPAGRGRGCGEGAGRAERAPRRRPHFLTHAGSGGVCAAARPPGGQDVARLCCAEAAGRRAGGAAARAAGERGEYPVLPAWPACGSDGSGRARRGG